MSIEREEKVKNVETIVGVFCDRCGASCMRACSHEFAEIRVLWGFDSRKDLKKHEVILCEDCYDLTIETMGIKPKITDMFFSA
jgi:hypothetical protein